MANSVHFSSKSSEWETPTDLFDSLNDEFGGFTLDPCCTAVTAKCPRYYTVEDNGLSKSWSDERVFMNPPYGRAISYWVRKAYMESLTGALVVCLLPARTDTAYWHDYIFGKAKEIRFLRGRLKFSNAKHSAPFPSAIVVFQGVNQQTLLSVG